MAMHFGHGKHAEGVARRAWFWRGAVKGSLAESLALERIGSAHCVERGSSVREGREPAHWPQRP